MNALERSFRRFDRFQQAHPPLACPIAAVQKFGNDRAGAFAGRIAYQGLFSLFPLLLLFTTVLGFASVGEGVMRPSAVLATFAVDFALFSIAFLVLTAQPLRWRDVRLGAALAAALPRSLTQPPLTDADRLVFARLACTTKRRPEHEVEVRFLDVADQDPLVAETPEPRR